MPYIKQEDRGKVAIKGADTAGELNYELTTTIRAYVSRKGLSYQAINDVVGALEGCKMEFYRRIATPYEDNKIKENGDVY